ncbi:MAG: hypothetical protein AAF627_08795 [Myxococcota bacterium]
MRYIRDAILIASFSMWGSVQGLATPNIVDELIVHDFVHSEIHVADGFYVADGSIAGHSTVVFVSGYDESASISTMLPDGSFVTWVSEAADPWHRIGILLDDGHSSILGDCLGFESMLDRDSVMEGLSGVGPCGGIASSGHASGSGGGFGGVDSWSVPWQNGVGAIEAWLPICPPDDPSGMVSGGEGEGGGGQPAPEPEPEPEEEEPPPPPPPPVTVPTPAEAARMYDERRRRIPHRDAAESSDRDEGRWSEPPTTENESLSDRVSELAERVPVRPSVSRTRFVLRYSGSFSPIPDPAGVSVAGPLCIPASETSRARDCLGQGMDCYRRLASAASGLPGGGCWIEAGPADQPIVVCAGDGTEGLASDHSFNGGENDSILNLRGNTSENPDFREDMLESLGIDLGPVILLSPEY